MRLSKKQIQEIIKQEKRILTEMNPMADADRSVGTLANVSSIDQVTDGILNILQEVEMGAQDEEGLEPDEAEEKARNAAILVVAQAFQSAGISDVYYGLTKMIR